MEKVPEAIALKCATLADKKAYFREWQKNGESWGKVIMNEDQLKEDFKKSEPDRYYVLCLLFIMTYTFYVICYLVILVFICIFHYC